MELELLEVCSYNCIPSMALGHNTQPSNTPTCLPAQPFPYACSNVKENTLSHGYYCFPCPYLEKWKDRKEQEKHIWRCPTLYPDFRF